MKAPRSYTEAKKQGWITKKVLPGNKMVRIDLTPRFYNGGKAIISFWLTYTGAKRLKINI